MKVPAIVAVLLVVLLLVVFGGRDPAKEARLAHQAKMLQGDPLVNAIEEYNDRSKSLGGILKMGNGSRMGGGGTKGSGGLFNAQRNGKSGFGGSANSNPNNVAPGTPANPYPNNNPNPTNNNQGNPYNQVNPYANSNILGAGSPQNNNQQALPDDSYYPPPPLDPSVPRSTLQDQNQQPHSSNVVPRNVLKNIPERVYSNPIFTVNGSQKIGFYGSQVFTLNPQGLPVALPDGEYSMADGSGKLTVHEGKKVISGGFF